MNVQKHKCQRIKQLIQSLSGVEDIGYRSRKRPFPEFKKIYFKLCKEFTSASLDLIGETLGKYNHASVLSGVKSFNNLMFTKQLDYLSVYKDAFKILNEEKTRFIQVESIGETFPTTLIGIKEQYRLKLYAITEKAQSQISLLRAENLKLQNEIHNLKNK